jgi:hypothetical protein
MARMLRLLAEKRGVDGRGIELSQAGVNSCVAQGLAVIQGDADTDLVYYPDLAFDYAILSQTIQTTYSPRDVLKQLLRIGRRAVVSFPLNLLGAVWLTWRAGLYDPRVRARWPTTRTISLEPLVRHADLPCSAPSGLPRIFWHKRGREGRACAQRSTPMVGKGKKNCGAGGGGPMPLFMQNSVRRRCRPVFLVVSR